MKLIKLTRLALVPVLVLSGLGLAACSDPCQDAKDSLTKQEDLNIVRGSQGLPIARDAELNLRAEVARECSYESGNRDPALLDWPTPKPSSGSD